MLSTDTVSWDTQYRWELLALFKIILETDSSKESPYVNNPNDITINGNIFLIISPSSPSSTPFILKNNYIQIDL